MKGRRAERLGALFAFVLSISQCCGLMYGMGRG